MSRNRTAACCGIVGVALVMATAACPPPPTPAAAPSSVPSSGPSSVGSSAGSVKLTVRVVGLRNGDGDLLVGVFRAADGFPADRAKAVAWRSAPADGDGAFQFDLPPGTYSVGVLHDENRNGRIDTGLFGIPKEGYGVTNNPKPHRRAATFAEATIDVRADPPAVTVTVSVQYDFL